MSALLLVVIYICFIGLGLPDSLLGAAWPAMHGELGAPISAAGAVSLIISGGTIVSSLFSVRVIRRFGVGKTTAVSVLMTAAALLLFSLAPHFLVLCLAAVPLGLGAGAVDAALNNFVALHYQARHMSWLHCFWGIGATAGPMLLSLFLNREGGWRTGYLTIAAAQSAIVLLLFLTLSGFRAADTPADRTDGESRGMRPGELLRLRGAKAALLSFFCYCGTESTVGLWGGTFLVSLRGLPADRAAQLVSLFYFGITAGRLLAGFLTMKLSNRRLIRAGELLCLAGAVLLLPPGPAWLYAAGFALLGLGCAPIYPCMLQETPVRFGREASQALMGLQMACAYVGSTLVPPLFGLLGNGMGMFLFPLFVLLLGLAMLLTSETANRRIPPAEASGA